MRHWSAAAVGSGSQQMLQTAAKYRHTYTSYNISYTSRSHTRASRQKRGTGFCAPCGKARRGGTVTFDDQRTFSHSHIHTHFHTHTHTHTHAYTHTLTHSHSCGSKLQKLDFHEGFMTPVTAIQAQTRTSQTGRSFRSGVGRAGGIASSTIWAKEVGTNKGRHSTGNGNTRRTITHDTTR